jgi:hypothetical protein
LSQRQWGIVAAGIVAVAVGVAVFAFGGDDDPEPELTTTPTPDLTTPTTTEQAQTNPDEEQDKPEKGGNNGDKPQSTGSDEPPALPPEQQPPGETIYGPPGTPAGTVPEGAGPSEDQQAVVRTLDTFLDAISRGDGPEACAQLSREGRKRVEREVHQVAPETQGTPCEGAIVLYQGGYGRSIRNPQYKNLQVSGDQASAIGPPSEKAALRKYARTWLIDNYGW